MCGLAGKLGKQPSRAAIASSIEALRHRGPDGDGVYLGDGVTLVHTRLNIIDLSTAGDQPMVDPGTGVVIVYNGEIYNMLKLREELGSESFVSRTDTEVVLKLYLRFGIQSVEKLRGMFALAIWDPRTETLYLARDRFGIKPLYIYCNDGEFIFGSEIKPMLLFGAPCGLDLNTVQGYLRDGLLATSSQTFFQGIKALQPGSYLSYRRGQVCQREYWTAAALRFEEDQSSMSDDEVEELVWEKLEEVVGQHLLSDVPVGISLSSGLDSRCLAEILSRLTKGSVHTFTFGFEERDYDEIRRTEEVRFPLDIKRHHLKSHATDMLGDLSKAIGVFESPLGGLGTLSSYRLMGLACEAGVPVLLSGEGADEVFGGYRYYHDTFFRELYNKNRHDELRYELAAYNRVSGDQLQSNTREFSFRVLGADSIMRAPDGTSLAEGDFLGPELQFGLEGKEMEPASELREAMLQDLTTLKIPKLLMFQDRAAMAFGIETRVPFLDHELVEMIFKLKTRWLIRDGVSKYLPKRLLKKKADVNLLDSGKLFVATPQREWLKGPLFNEVNKLLDGGCLAEKKLIDYPVFKGAYADYAASPELANSFFVWKIINLELLMQRFFAN